MVAPVLVQVCALLAGTALMVQHIAKPRLPVYKLSVGWQGWRQIPLLTKSAVTGEWNVAVTTGVDLYNANFLHLDVHAISFDMYADMTDERTGRQVLRHIGNIQDKQQHQKVVVVAAAAADDDLSIKEKENTWNRRRWNTKESSLSAPQQQKQQQSRRQTKKSDDTTRSTVLWSIEARSNFTTTTTMYISLNLSALVRSLAQLAVRWWHGSGRLTLPTTGVAHIRAVSSSRRFHQSANYNPKNKRANHQKTKVTQAALLQAPLTVSIICDNLVDTWNMQVVGTECTLYNMVPGWLDLNQAAAAVREYAVAKLAVNATGGVLLHPATSWQDILSTLAWEETLQLL